MGYQNEEFICDYNMDQFIWTMENADILLGCRKAAYSYLILQAQEAARGWKELLFDKEHGSSTATAAELEAQYDALTP